MRNPCAGASLAAIIAGCAASNVGTDPVVPDNLKVPAGQTLSLVSRATGVQIYECSAGKTDPAKFEWAFKARKRTCSTFQAGRSANTMQVRPGNRTMEARWSAK